MLTRPHRPLWPLAAAGVLFTFPPAPVGGQEVSEELFRMSLEELLETRVFVASKREESVVDAPGIITVVTARDIEAMGARNLADIVNRLPNTQMVSSTVHPNGATSIRGGLLTHIDNHVLILINGRPMHESQAGGINADFYLAYPVEVIERIEIIRGPGSVLYGTNAFAGVMNVVTKKGSDGSEVAVSTSYGSFDTREVTGYGGATYGDLDFYLGVKHLKADGWRFNAIDGAGTPGTMRTAKSATLLTLNAEYLGFTTNIILDDTYQNANAPAFLWPAERAEINRRFIDVGYQTQVADDWSLTGNLTFNGHEFSFPINGAPTITDFKSSGWLAEVSTSLRITEDLRLLMGAKHDVLRGDIGVGTVDDYQSRRNSFFAQTDYRVFDSVKLVAGFQWNKPADIGADIAPRVGLIVNQGPWGLKLLYGEAFRSGFGGQLFLATPFFVGNPELKPEVIQTFDAQVLYRNERYQGALAYYYQEISDIHVRGPNDEGITHEMNGGSVDGWGIEVDGKAYVNATWGFEGSLSYQKTSDDEGRQDAKLGPNVMAKIGLTFQPDEGITLGLFNSYFGAAGRVERLVPGVAVVNPRAKAYSLMTAKLSLDISSLLGKRNGPRSTFSLYVDNVLDEDIYYPDINTKVVNTLPVYSGRALYATFTLGF